MNTNIHLKLDYIESVNSKREILFSEKEILQTMRHIRNYNALRKQENSVKVILKDQVSELRKEIDKIESLMPRDVHFKKEELEIKHIEITPKVKKIKQKEIKSQIEQELEEIEAKLARLQ